MQTIANLIEKERNAKGLQNSSRSNASSSGNKSKHLIRKKERDAPRIPASPKSKCVDLSSQISVTLKLEELKAHKKTWIEDFVESKDWRNPSFMATTQVLFYLFCIRFYSFSFFLHRLLRICAKTQNK